MKKISLVTSQGKKQMCCGELIILSEPQYEKLTDNHFAKQIDSIAKDLHVDWAIDVTSDANVLNITRTTANVIDDAFYHDLEIAAANFMSAIDKLEYDKKEPECPSHEEENSKEEKRVQFVKSILRDMTQPENPDSEVIGADIKCMGPAYLPFAINWGGMSGELLKEMCELYLAAHNK